MKDLIFHKGVTYFTLFFLCIVFSYLSPVFLSWDNCLNILLASSIIGLLAIASALVMAAAGLDLSIGSLVAFSGAASSLIFINNFHWLLAVLVCIFSGLMIGFINGGIIAYLKLPAFIVTLGMLSICRALALIITGGMPAYGLPDQLIYIGQGVFLGIPIPIYIFLIVGLFMHLLLRKTVFGTHILAIGDNESAVYQSGINIKSIKIKLYMLSGALAGLAGLIFMGRVNAADPNAGMMYELAAITAAVLGGTRLFGGKASIVGAMLGALIMGVLENGLILLAVPSYYQQLAVGGFLILAVAIDQLNAKRSEC